MVRSPDSADTRRLARRRCPNRAGYTLVEILVVISITTILSGFLISYNSTGRQVIALQTERAKIGQMIARAKSLALSNYTRLPQPCGYGLRVNYASGTYAIVGYNDLAGNCASTSTFDFDDFTVIESSTVSRSLRLQTSIANRLDDVAFVAPDPRVYVNSRGTIITEGSASIGLIGISGTSTGTVSVSAAGQINF